ncbi:hypothetical protein SAMN05216390_10568 [Lachnospiraceae bacterium KH1T2]|nr:hypothetical protein SAMN05216390_10568 [Lachnospiraceae bacterium KH1T2]
MKIKRGGFIILLFPLIILLTYFFGDCRNVEFDKFYHGMVMTKEGNIVIAANDIHYGSHAIFMIDTKGEVQHFGVIENNLFEGFNRIVRLTRDDEGCVYCFTEGVNSAGENIFSIYKCDEHLHNIELIKKIQVEQLFTVDSILVAGEDIFLTGRAFTGDDTNTNAKLLKIPMSEDEHEYYSLAEFSTVMADNSLIKKVLYDGDVLYLLDEKARLWRYDWKKRKYTEANEFGKISWIQSSFGGIYYSKLESDEILYKGKDGREKKIEYKDELVSSRVYKDGFVNMEICDNKLYIEGYCSDGEFKITQLNMSLYKYLVHEWRRLLYRYIIFILIIIFIKLGRNLLWKKKSLSIRVITCIIVINIAFSIALSLGVLYQFIRDEASIRGEDVAIFSMGLLNYVNDFDVEKINYKNPEEIINSKLYKNLDEKIYSLCVDNGDVMISYVPTVIYADKEDRYIVFAEDKGIGETIEGAYGLNVSSFVNDVIEGDYEDADAIANVFGEIKYFYITHLRPETEVSNSGNLYLLSSASMKDVEYDIINMLKRHIMWELIYVGFSTLVMVIVLAFFLKPIKTLKRYMAIVADGMYDLPDRIYPDNEIGEMWIYLNSLCSALKVRNVAKGQLLNYFARFVPKGFERLFEVNEMQEIADGNVRSFSAAMAVICLDESIYKTNETKRYSDYKQTLFNKLCVMAAKHKGIVIANDGDINTVRVVFSSIDARTQHALDFALEIVNVLVNLYNDRKCVVLLHEGTFTCGLIGNQSQAYTYVRSNEIDDLKKYMPKLSKAGVKLVTTEAMRVKLIYSETFRYIGDVESSYGKTYRLYEDLHACSKEIRDKKLSCDDEMQDSIIKFYHGEYHKARDGFSRIVKQMPEDGIAVWYLFRCEELMQGNDRDTRKTLFCKEQFKLI